MKNRKSSKSPTSAQNSQLAQKYAQIKQIQSLMIQQNQFQLQQQLQLANQLQPSNKSTKKLSKSQGVASKPNPKKKATAQKSSLVNVQSQNYHTTVSPHQKLVMHQNNDIASAASTSYQVNPFAPQFDRSGTLKGGATFGAINVDSQALSLNASSQERSRKTSQKRKRSANVRQHNEISNLAAGRDSAAREANQNLDIVPQRLNEFKSGVSQAMMNNLSYEPSRYQQQVQQSNIRFSSTNGAHTYLRRQPNNHLQPPTQILAQGVDPEQKLEEMPNTEHLESQIQSKIKDLEQKYNSNILSQDEGATMEEGENSQEGQDGVVAEDQGRNVTFQEDAEEELHTQSQDGDVQEETINASSRPELPQLHAKSLSEEKNAMILSMLDRKAPSKFDAMHTNKTDQVHRDLSTIIDNFESVFVAFINQNYRTFTEKDLERIIQDELRQNIIAKVKEIDTGESYQNCDPYKIEEILENTRRLRATNEGMRESIHKVGVTVNQLAKTSFNLKNDNFINAQMETQIRDIAQSIDTLNHLFNDVHFKVLQNDDQLSQIGVTCATTLSSHNYLKKLDSLSQQYDKLQGHHSMVKQQLWEQAQEHKKLQHDYDMVKTRANQNETESHKLSNMEALVEEKREENQQLASRIEDLQATLFGKERDIDKLRHQLKHGVASGGISLGFDHNYAGEGGSISTGNIVSKIEKASMQQQLLSAAQNNQLKWRENSSTLIRLALRFMDSMRQLQKAVHHGQAGDALQGQKMTFESNKKELENAIKRIKGEIEDTSLEVFQKGEKFGELPTDEGPETRTQENITKIGNILTMQHQQLQQAKSGGNSILKQEKRGISIQRGPQAQFQSPIEHNADKEPFRPSQSPNIALYKPQQLIRLEEEKLQLVSELETMQKFVEESQNKIENLTQCVQESNTGIFLREQELQRLRAKNEELSKQNADLFNKVGEEQIDTNNEGGSRVDYESEEQSVDPIPKKQVAFGDFEKNLVDVKQTIKETDELIARSKGHIFSQDDIEEQPIEKGKNPFKKNEGLQVDDTEKVQQSLVEKMNKVLEEKDETILELTLTRQKLTERVNHLQAQIQEYRREIDLLNEEIQSLKVEENATIELERTRQEVRYLEEKLEMANKEVHRLEESLKCQDNLHNEKNSAQLASQIQECANIKRQLDEERHEFIVQTREMQDLQAEMGIRQERHIKLQSEFNDLSRIRLDLEKQIENSKIQVLRDRDLGLEVQHLTQKLKMFDDQVNKGQDHIKKLQIELKESQATTRQHQVKLETIEKEKAIELQKQVSGYQDEIMRLTDNQMKQTLDLKQQMTAKQEEVQYHEKTVEIRKEGQQSEIQRLHGQFEKERQGYLTDIEQLNTKISEMRQEQNQKINKTQSIAAQSQSIEHEVAKAGLEAQVEDLKLAIRGKDSQIQQLIANQEETIILKTKLSEAKLQLSQSDQHQKSLELLLEEKERKIKSVDKVEEQVVKKNRELQEQIRELTDTSSKKSHDIKELEVKIQSLLVEKKSVEEKLKIAESQIYENNEAHLKQTKELRNRLDDSKLQTQYDQRVGEIKQLNQTIEDMQGQITVQREMLEVNAEDLDRAKQDADRLIALKKECDQLSVRNHQLQTNLTEMTQYKNQCEVSESEIKVLTANLTAAEKKFKDELMEGAKMNDQRNQYKREFEALQASQTTKDDQHAKEQVLLKNQVLELRKQLESIGKDDQNRLNIQTKEAQAAAIKVQQLETSLIEEQSKYQTHMNELKIGNQKLEKEAEQLQQEHAKVIKKMKESNEVESQANLKDFHSVIETKEAQITELRDKIENMVQEAVKKVNADKERQIKEQKENQNVMDEIMRIKQEKLEIQEELDQVRATQSPALAQNVPRGSVETIVSEANKAKIDELNDELRDKEEENYELEQQIDELNNKIESLTTENEILVARAEEKKGGKKSDAFGFSEESDGSKEKGQEQIEQLKNEIEELKAEKQKLAEQIVKLTMTIEQLNEKNKAHASKPKPQKEKKNDAFGFSDSQGSADVKGKGKSGDAFGFGGSNDDEDEFFNRPSKLSDELAKQDQAEVKLNEGDKQQLQELNDNLKQLQVCLNEAKSQTIEKLEAKISQRLQDVHNAFINENILKKSLKEGSQLLQNDQIQEICRVEFGGEVMILLQPKQSLEDKIARKKGGEISWIQESSLTEAQRQYLLSFTPEIQCKVKVRDDLEEFEEELGQLLKEKAEFDNEYKLINARIKGDSLDPDEQDYKGLMNEYNYLEQQTVELDQRLNQQLLQNIEYKSRIQSLNKQILQLTQAKGNDSIPNLNDQQLSYGKNILFDKSKQSDAPTVTDVDFSRGQDSSDDKSGEGAAKFEHIKSSLIMFLKKTPVFDKASEQLLVVVFSMLALSKQEIEEMEQARSLSPIYKIDEKATKKQEKQIKAQKQTKTEQSQETEGDKKTSSKFGRLFGKKKEASNQSAGVNVSMSSVGPANLSQELTVEEKKKQEPSSTFSPFVRRKDSKLDTDSD